MRMVTIFLLTLASVGCIIGLIEVLSSPIITGIDTLTVAGMFLSGTIVGIITLLRIIKW